ncbi:MAG: tRNA (adenosine(37)-N6)-dimethylallyltransferase MiaA [Minisyncoccia bacterium]
MNKNDFLKKIIVILGPTASGKSKLAVDIALWLKKTKNIECEIISADSRQVYKEMNLGTGKITKKEMEGVKHHLLDIMSPKRQFTVVHFVKLAKKAINEIFKRKKIPVICGGTAFYIYALIDGISIPEVKPNLKLRKKLEKKNAQELFNILFKIDPERVNKIDKNNKRRLIRAIEIVKETKSQVPKIKYNPLPYPVIFLGIKKNKDELEKLIKKRLLLRIKKGMIEEVKKLRKMGVSWKRLNSFGLEYRIIAKYLKKEIDYNKMLETLFKEIVRFSKQQMTWWKNDKRIYWINNKNEAKKIVKEFLFKN